MVDTNLGVSINILKDYTIEMIEKCEVALKLSIQSIVEKDLDLANKVIKEDDEINELRSRIRKKSIELIALRQPMAKDLRHVYSLAIISNDLERIGDYSVNIAQETLKIGTQLHVKELVDIPLMAKKCSEMLEEVKYALKNEDIESSREIALKDNIVDELYEKVRMDCLTLMKSNSEKIEQCVQFLYIGRHLERAADHITNICELVIYIANGEMIEIG